VVSVVWVGGLVGIGRNYSAVAVVVYVGEEVAQDAAHLDRGEGRGVAALLWDAVAGAQVVARAAREHARALLAGRALHTLVAGAIVPA
jgi:predicted metal-dependent hydrolase